MASKTAKASIEKLSVCGGGYGIKPNGRCWLFSEHGKTQGSAEQDITRPCYDKTIVDAAIQIHFLECFKVKADNHINVL